MKTLKLNREVYNEEARELKISDNAFTQLTGECPILKLSDDRYTYMDGTEDWVEYQLTREFTINDVDPNEAVLFETASPENSL